MMIEDVRFRWGYDPDESEIFAVINMPDGDSLVIESPMVAPMEGVGIKITELLEAVAAKGLISERQLSVAIGRAREHFKSWGIPWESAQ